LKFTSAAKSYKADVLILGGDMTGKLLIPIVRHSNGSFTADFLGANLTMKTPAEVESLEKKIRNSGYYPYRADESELAEWSVDRAKVDDAFSRAMVESVERWVKIAEERLRGSGIKCFITPGNDDRPVIEEALAHSDCVSNPEGKVVDLNGYNEMISLGYSNLTPWKAPRDIPEEELELKIEKTASEVRSMKDCVFNMHCPPCNTPLDSATEVDKNLKPVLEGGKPKTIAAGSVAVRKAIEKYQPLLGLHGHIHESRGAFKLGRTTCINPGSEYTEGILRGVIVDVEKKGVKAFLMTSG